ncbi:hypothetical protein AN958_09726 [Leucoagaricus sp. SymC.cos]|nr:hypothetical protein AN958_09726 [Leucoagaricus sp. SymC.cos]
MYRTASPPLFDIPDFPTLRRVKPLPKRRRTSLDINPDLNVNIGTSDLQDRLFLRAETDRLLAQADSLSAKMALRSYYHSMGYGVPEFTSGAETSPPLPPSVPGSGINHLETVSANGMAPSNGAVGSVMKGSHSANAAPGNGYVAVGVGRTHGEEDGDGRGGDYTDHLNQQGQGNTKKRKVPANVGSSPPHHHHHHLHHYSSHRGTMGPYGSYGQPADVEGEEKELSFGLGFGLDLGSEATAEDPRSGEILGGVESDIFGPLPRPNETYAPQQHSVQVDPAHQLRPRQFHRKPKLSPATLAGLQRKELVRSRKKHLETIMGTIPVRDAWTLDHALSPNFPPLLASFASANSKGLKMRLSKRGKMRFARMARMGLGRLGRHPDAAPFPTGEFTFSHPSATAERLVSIQEEVANLRNLFGRELARQTAKAAKIASGPSKSGGGSGKTGKKRAQQRAKTIMSAKSGEQQAEFLEMPQKGANSLGQPQGQSQVSQTQSQGQAPTPKKGKKKKRSTMANASNPHHLRNYVPSRLPHASGGGGSTGVNGQGNQATNANALWPLALKFLAADLPPRRRKDSTGRGQNGINVESLPHLVVPQEEWICSFCEYGLFYGEEAEYKRALRNRKKILKRRRRARERASAAASGVNAAMKNAAGAAPVTEKTQVAGDDEEYDASGYEDAPPSSVNGRIDGTARTRARGLPAR